nr:pilus assembly protein [Anaerolineae bacterium]
MKRTQKEKGQSLIEFALLLPVLLIVLAGVLDLGRLYYAYVAVSDAAAEGAAYAAIHPDDTEGVVERAQAASSGLVEIDEGLVEIDCPTVAPGAPVTVTVSYTFTVATPFINAMVPDGVLMLRAVATDVILTGEF